MRDKFNLIITKFTDLIKSAKGFILKSKFKFLSSNFHLLSPIHRRKRLVIMMVMLIIIIPAVFLTLKYARPTVAAWFDEAWGYRQRVDITNAGSAQTDYQVAITLDTATLISAGKMQTNCNDIRVTDANGKVLPYWIASCNNASTKIWPKVPSLPTTGATVFLYYGNPSAAAGKTKVGTQTYPGLSCKSVLDAGDSSGTGNYWIDPTNGNTSDSFQAYCDMTNDSGGWMLVTQSMVNSEDGGSTSSVKTNGSNSGLIYTTTITGASDCNTHYGKVYFTDIIPWTQIKADYQFIGGNSCWAIFGDSGFSADTNLIPFASATDTIRNQVKMGGSNGDNFDGINVRCDNETTNFWHALNGISTVRSAQVILRRNSMASLAGLGIGTACVNSGYPWTFQNIYIRESSMEPANITVGSPANEEKSQAPIAYWKFDEGYGTSPKDSTPNNHTLTYNGTPVWQTEDACISGKCIKYPTNSDYNYITVPSNSPMNFGTSNFTVSLWQKVFQPTTHGSGIIGRYPHNSSYNGNFSTGISDDLTTYFFYQRDMSGVFDGYGIDYTQYFGKWTHVEWVRSGSNMILYINGVLKQTFNITNTPNISFSGSPFYFGNTGWAPGVMSNLMLDEVKMYNYARTPAQIKSDYASRGSTKGVSVQMGASNKNLDALSNGLVGYWKMDESATPSVDSSGNGNSGTWNGTTAATSGKYGNGTVFDGDSDYIEMADTPSLSPGGAFTFSTWIYQTAACTSDCIIFNKESEYEWRVLNGSIDYAIANTSPGWAWISTGITISQNTWTHLVLTYDSTTQEIRAYKDGTLVSTRTSSTGSLPDYGATLRLAARSGPGSFFGGKLDEVRIYNRALSPKEVSDLYNWAPGPNAYWDFENDTTSTVTDKSGNGLDLSVSGSPTFVTGKYGKALKINGGSDAATSVSTSILDTDYHTIGFWLKFDQTAPSNWGKIFGYTPTGSDRSPGIWTYPSANCLHWRYDPSNSGPIICGGPSGESTYFNNNQWYYITGVKNGGTFSFYVNGILSESGAVSSPKTSGSSTITLGGGSPYVSMDEVRIYNYDRTSKQIIEDMNAGHSAVSSNTPIGYWKLDEGYSTTANNTGSQGTTLNGTLRNSPTWTNEGKFGKGITLDGLNDHITVPNNDSIEYSGGDLTLSVWFKPDASDDGGEIISRPWNGSGQYNYWISSNGGANPTPGFVLGGLTTYSLSFNQTISSNEWHYLAATVNSSKEVKLYIDGKLTNSGTHSITTWIPSLGDSHLNLAIGTLYPYGDAWEGVTAYSVKGSIDEVKFYNSALTADEIKLDYNHGSAMVLGESVEDNSDNPVGYWKLDEGVYNGTSGEVKDVLGIDNGTSSSPTAASTGKINGAALNPNIAVGDSTTLNITDKLTMEYWFMPSIDVTSMGTYPIGVFKRNWAVGGYGSHFSNANGFVNFQWCWVGSCDGISSTTSFKANIWYHYAATYDGSYVRLYINGVQEDYKAIGTPMASSAGYPLYLGLGDFQGKFDEVKIYHYARSAAQIKADAATSTLNPALPGAPVAEWNFEEKTGTNAYDTSGNGNTCTLTNSPTWVTGKIGGATQYVNPTDNYLDCGNNSSLTVGTNDFTLSAWLHPTLWASSKEYAYFYRYKDGSNDNGFDFELDTYGGVTDQYNVAAYRIQTTSPGYASMGISSFKINKNTWSYVTVVRQGTSLTWYLNGVKYNTNTTAENGTNFNSTSDFMIGKTAWGSAHQYQGSIDQVKIYDYARTPAQIAYDYNRGGPVAQWEMDECQGGTVNDSSGNGNNGTITIGALGTQTSAGTCTTSGTAWGNGATGKFNSSINLDGRDDTISVTGSNSLLNIGNGSISFWVYPKGRGTNPDNNQEGKVNLSWRPLIYGTQGVGIYWSGASTEYLSGTTLPDNVWTYVTVVWENAGSGTGNGVIRIYFDGVLKNTYSSLTLPANSSSGVDIGHYGGVSNFNGQIDDVRIYNYALTTTQIKQVYNNGAVNFGPATGSP